jgi:2-keto-4-pentenoate hydratase
LKPLLSVAVLVACLSSAPIKAKDGSADDWADIVQLELARGQPMPLLSVYYDQLNSASAYDIQQAFVIHEMRKKRVIGGFKAGFTQAALRAKYRTKEPVSGVLFADAGFKDGDQIDSALFKKPMLEVEIGYVLRSPITRRLHSVADLKTYISHALPAVEIPDLNYVNVGGLNANDIIATNVAASRYVVGKPFVLSDLAKVNEIRVALYRDEQVVDTGAASDALGNQLEALLWLVNDAYAHGWHLQAGHVLLTGTLGKMNPGLPGNYRADYGLGRSLSFVLKPATPPAQIIAK